MQINCIPRVTSFALSLVLVCLLGTSGLAFTRPPDATLLTAKGKGTIQVGHETFDVTNVVVKLLEDGTCEITLVSDITFFLMGKWTVASESPKTFNLTITGSMSGGGAQGTGKLILKADGKSLASLNAQGSSKTSPRKITLTFLADE